MGSSRKRRSSNLAPRIQAALAPHVIPGARLTLGLSGGVDSVVLLDLLATLAGPLDFRLACLHVHHGISRNADAWAEAALAAAARYAVPCVVERVDIVPFRHLGLEGAARLARYRAFERAGADLIALAHQRDDQAETLLVQLLRGTGVAGMAAMPILRDPGSGIAGQGGRSEAWSGIGSRGPEQGERRVLRIVRPMLEVRRGEILAHAREHALAWVEDESNADLARTRNHLRHRVMPVLSEVRPGATAAIARAAAHFGEAASLLEDLARIDAAACTHEGHLVVGKLATLTEPRARNLLRFHLAECGIAPPDARKLAEILRQLLWARGDASLEFALGEWCLRRYDGRVWIERAVRELPSWLRMRWTGERLLPVPALGGTLRFEPGVGDGVAAAALACDVEIRIRGGGERLRLHERGPRRALKDLFQEARVPPWLRSRLPLVHCDGELAWVPGLGADWRFRARPGEAGVRISWDVA